MKHHKGFTLFELMITVAILGIVAAIAIPAYTGYLESARMTEAHNNIAALKLAEEEFFLENNSYFAGATTAATASASSGLWKATGTDGAINFDYKVEVGSTGSITTSYKVTATGKTGTPVAGKTESYSN